MLAVTINHILVASQFTSSDSETYEYYDDFDDYSTTTEYPTQPPTPRTTTTTTTTTTYRSPFFNRRTSRPTIQFYNKPLHFSNPYNNNQNIHQVDHQQFQPIETTTYQPLQQTTQVTTQRPRTTRANSVSPAGANRNAIVDLERSENRKNYAQSRIADDTEEDEKFLSRRYARFLFMRRVG